MPTQQIQKKLACFENSKDFCLIYLDINQTRAKIFFEKFTKNRVCLKVPFERKWSPPTHTNTYEYIRTMGQKGLTGSTQLVSVVPTHLLSFIHGFLSQ